MNLQVPRNKNALTAALLTLAFTMGPTTASAQSSQQPVEVSADRATFEQDAGTGVYRGDAELIQGERRLNADVIRLFTEDNQLVRVEATGSPVRMVEGEALSARAENLVYNLTKRSLVLTGNAHVNHQGNTFEGAKVEYNLDSRRVDASSEGDKRVRLVIPAKNAEKNRDQQENDNAETP